MTHEVRLHVLAEGDLFHSYAYIARQSGVARAREFAGRIETACATLRVFPERGLRRDDLAPGLRTLSIDRRVLIAYRLRDTTVEVPRILYAGRELGAGDLPS